MSFHNASFIRGNLPNKPIELHAVYTQRGSLCNRREQREHLDGSPGNWQCPQVACIQWTEVWRALSMTHGTAKLKHWVVRTLSCYSPQGVEVPLIYVQMQSLSKCLNLWFGALGTHPKGIPITPHYLTLHIALDITDMADSSSILD